MWEPVGPLPAHVYWKRRWLALASVIGFFVVVGFSLAALTAGPSDAGTTDEATTRAASQTELAPGATSAPQGSGVPSTDSGASGPTSVAGTTPPDVGLSATGVPMGTSTSALPPSGPQSGSGAPVASSGPMVEGGPATTDETVRPDDTPRASVAVPPAAAPPATGPPPCTNDMIAVGAEIDTPQHRVGDRPQLRLVVVNISAQACVRDLDGALQEIVVWDRAVKNRLWSSNDCINPSTKDLRTLVPGQPVAFAVTWSGLSSNPGCTAPRTRIPAGDYTLLTRVADKISGPTPFTLTPR